MTIDAIQSESDSSQIVRDLYWQAGFEDGTIGQTWLEHRRVLQAEADHDKAAEISGIEQRLEDSKAELAIITAEADRERRDFEDLAEQMHKATLDRDRYPAQYSRAVGWGFILCAVAILIADFPLSRAISVEILHDKAAAFFSHTNAVAFGIVAMGLFFKILADPFTRPRYLLPRFLRPISWITTSVLAVLMAAVLATVLGMLGIFRADTLAQDGDVDSAAIVYGSTPSVPPASTSTAGPVSSLRRTFDAMEIGFVSKVAFLALGLVLPLLGGIFLSTGASRLHNYAHVERLQRRYPERRLAYEELARRQHACGAQGATLDRERSLAQQRPTLANSRYHRYLHGYERGLCIAGSPSAGIGQEVRDFVGRWVTAARQRDSMLRTQAIADSGFQTLVPPPEGAQ